MTSRLEIDYACCTETGAKSQNADAADARIPPDDLLLSKGVAAVIADGMSSSEGGHEASQICVTGFLNDYFSTPESWSVKTSASKILSALNTWLCGQGQSRYDSPKGMVTTLSVAVIKSTTAHLFHVGDSRIYLYREQKLKQQTKDHRVWVSRDQDLLSRAMGIDSHLEIDYRSLALQVNDLLLFTTDGVHDFLTDRQLQKLLREHQGNLQQAANAITVTALEQGSNDNVTCQLLKVMALPDEQIDDIYQRVAELPFPPNLLPGMNIDGFQIMREIHASKRSEVYLAINDETGEQVALKTPSVNFSDDPDFLNGFLNEEWIGRRINSPHVLKVHKPGRRRFLYHVTEYLDGQTLRQRIDDLGQMDLEQTREYLTQIISGLRAFHRMEMIHQDLKPDNILINKNGILKIIDFGSTRIAGVQEQNNNNSQIPLGTINYTAPEYLDGSPGSHRSDIFSLGVIAYEMLTGALPYGDHEQALPARKMSYQSAREHNPAVPAWIDGALRKATHPLPEKRYEALSEFLQDMTHPNPELIIVRQKPLIERHPLGFWKTLAALLFLTNLVTLLLLFGAQ
ncbi:bifunctional protein-serine/threonine kinase/phosphatase [Sedimenticola sp.]|uniref:bifunctional protein-serine/threonine kinase/phosphatase n=1 Tax=Sedimenticola sp. TaxID=1940285 RepID=UPI00258FBC1C|nr:bifunctional protein-serine/threonine kinase/phosphatase [Sedimenticola sp.]MCW8904363.1 protein kinase [Sedimenticola sp.]